MSLKNILAAKGGDVISIEPTADLAEAAKLLSTHRIGVLVVLDADKRLAGILSERDIVRARSDGSEGTGRGGDDAQRHHVRRERFDQRRHRPHDEG